MSLSCACDFDDYWEFFSCKEVTARKRHRCGECGRVINPGEEYENFSGKWDGRMLSHHTCSDCLDLREAYTELGYCYTFGTLLDDHLENIEQTRPLPVHAWAVARRMVAMMRARDKVTLLRRTLNWT